MTPMQRGGCWRWPWCLKDISGAKPASSVAWTGRPCATGFSATTPKESGGFLCNTYQYVLDRFEKDLDADEKRALREELVEGMELSPKVGRMCAMNVHLHGIGGDKVVIHNGHDSLAAPWGQEYTMVLTNPPFGKKQSLLFVNEEGDTEKEDQVVVREDFWTSTRAVGGGPPLRGARRRTSLWRCNGSC